MRQLDLSSSKTLEESNEFFNRCLRTEDQTLLAYMMADNPSIDTIRQDERYKQLLNSDEKRVKALDDDRRQEPMDNATTNDVPQGPSEFVVTAEAKRQARQERERISNYSYSPDITRLDNDMNKAALESQRNISQVVIGDNEQTSITVEVTPDGDCGFTATEYALNIADKCDLAKQVTRKGFFQTVSNLVSSLREDKNNAAQQKLRQLLTDLYHDEGLSFDTSENLFQTWKKKFGNRWANDYCFKLLSYAYNIRFEFYVVDHSKNDRLIPRGGSIGDGSVICETKEEITIRLLHDKNSLIDTNKTDTNNHFDLLVFDAEDTLKTKITNLGYSITQEKMSNTPTDADSRAISIQEEKKEKIHIEAKIVSLTSSPHNNCEEKTHNSRDDDPEKRLAHDLSTLGKIYEVINTLLTEESEGPPINLLRQLGELFKKISWKEDDENAIRNKHGYRNRHKNCGNKLNQQGAKLDFETFSHLSEIKESKAAELLWSQQKSLIRRNFDTVREKINFIIATENPKKTIRQEAKNNQQSTIHLRCFSAFQYDLICIQRLLSVLTKLDCNYYKNLDLSLKRHRYQLGYLLLMLGETAKELSDFIKPENHSKSPEQDTSRFLFVKLGHYRQKIKDKPHIVYSENFKQLTLMHHCLSKVTSDLSCIFKCIQIEMESCIGQGIASYQNGDLINKIMLENQEKITVVILTLRMGLSAFDILKKYPACIKQEQKIIESYTAELKSLKSQPVSKIASECKAEQKAVQLIKHKPKVAKQLINLIAGCAGTAMTASNLENITKILITEVQKRIMVLPQRVSSGKTQADKCTLVIGKVLPPYLKTLQKRKEYPHLANKIKSGDYSDAVNILVFSSGITGTDKTAKEEKKAKIQSLEAKLKSSKERRSEYQKKLQEAKDCCITINHSSQLKPQANLSKYEKLIMQIISEIDFMHELFSEINNAIKNDNDMELSRLILAEKMAFGFLGQLYKTLTNEEYRTHFSEYLFKHSILSTDILEAIRIRHKQICHDVFNCDEKYVLSAAREQVMPWLNEFKHMATLFPSNSTGVGEVSSLVANDARLHSGYADFSDSDKEIFLVYKKIVALNRFMRSNQALAEYQDLMKRDKSGHHKELLAELHWQASLAYRNLGDFDPCIKSIEKAIASVDCITDTTIRKCKTAAFLYDKAVACIQVDRHTEAIISLKRATEIAEPKQQIGINILLGAVEFRFSDQRDIGLSRLELTFTKYFHVVRNTAGVAMNFIGHLLGCYLDTFQLVAARDCLRLLSELLQRDFHQLLPKEGQTAQYLKLTILIPMAEYRILAALATENEQQAQQELLSIHDDIMNTRLGAQSFPYLQTREYDDVVRIKSALLCDRTSDCPYLAELNNSETKNESRNNGIFDNKEQVSLRLKSMRSAVCLFKCHDATGIGPAPFKSKLDCDKELREDANQIISFYYSLALSEFARGNFQQARQLMKTSILARGLSKFIYNEFDQLITIHRQRYLRCNGQNATVSLLQLYEFAALSISQWATHGDLDITALTRYVRDTLRQEDEAAYSLVGDCLRYGTNISAMNKMIADRENNLGQVLAFEAGESKCIMQVKFHNGKMQHRMFQPLPYQPYSHTHCFPNSKTKATPRSASQSTTHTARMFAGLTPGFLNSQHKRKPNLPHIVHLLDQIESEDYMVQLEAKFNNLDEIRSARDKNGNTVFHLCVRQGNYNALGILQKIWPEGWYQPNNSEILPSALLSPKNLVEFYRNNIRLGYHFLPEAKYQCGDD